MKKLLSSVVAGSLLSAITILSTPIASVSQTLQGPFYRPCKVLNQWFGCRLQSESIGSSSRQYSLTTMGEEVNLLISCDNISYPNQRTSGVMTNKHDWSKYNIECIYNISTRSNRSLSVYYKGDSQPIFTVNHNHNIGR